MAILEVHDGRGKVEYVTIGHDHTALLGSDPKCDIVLPEGKILPFHGRLRFKGGKFKAEAFPEAQAIEVNGKRVAAASFRQGDELRIGSYRIFLQSMEDGPAADEKTRAQARARPLQRGARAAASVPPASSASLPAPPARTNLLTSLLAHLKGREQRPGEERLTRSPLFLGLAIALVLLVISAVGLWTVISERAANNSFQMAMDQTQARDHRAALKAWDDFLNGFPTDSRRGTAWVQRALVRVKQFSDVPAPDWEETVKTVREVLPEIEAENEYESVREELGGIVLHSAEELADLAAAGADESILAQSTATLTLHDKIAGEQAVAIRGKSSLPKKLEAARAAVRKKETRERTIAAMSAAVAAKSSADVYAARDALVAEYPDLIGDKQVVEQLKAANELVRQGVKLDPSKRPAVTEAVAEPMHPPVTLVERQIASEPAAEGAGAKGPPVYAVVEGLVFGLDGGSGQPQWQSAIGLSTPFAPVPVPGSDPSILLFDSRFDELLRLDGRSGKLIWRQAIGEPVTEVPLVLGNQAIVVTPTGKLLVLALASGELRGTLDLGRPIARTPVSDESGQYFYVLGEKDCLFVVKRDPLECTGVEYLGHPTGSIGVSPARVGPYLVVPENRGLWEGRWTVFQIENDGARLRERQQLPIRGWTWTPPVSQGAVIWSVTDRGSVASFALGPPEGKQPLTPIAATLPDERPLGPAFARVRSERELWLSAHRAVRFDLLVDQAALSVSWALEQVGPALAPIQVADRIAVMTHRERDGRGVAVFGVDPTSGQIVWKSVLGKAWPVALRNQEGEDLKLRTAAIDGSPLDIDAPRVEQGGFVEIAPARPGYFALPPGPLDVVKSGDVAVVLPAADAEYLLVRKGNEALRRVDLPGPLGARPLFWGEDLVIPGRDGRVDLIDPLTGAPRAEPYVPVFDRTKPLVWRNPVRLVDDAVIVADATGRLRRLTKRTEPRVRLVPVGDEVNLGSPLVADPAATEQAVILVTADRKVRALAGRDLSPLGAWNLEAPLATRPESVGGHVFVSDAAGTVMAFGPDGQKLWDAGLHESPPLGPPAITGDVVWFLSRKGILEQRNLADGTSIDMVELGLQPTGGLANLGRHLLVPVAPGTVRVFDTKTNAVAER